MSALANTHHFSVSRRPRLFILPLFGQGQRTRAGCEQVEDACCESSNVSQDKLSHILLMFPRMFRSWLAAIALVSLLVTPAMAQSDTPSDAQSDQTSATPAASLSEADIAALLAPSVVQVLAGDKTGSGVAIGRGFITDQHVIDGADQIQIATADGQTYDAFIARSDRGSDLGLLLSEAPASPLGLEPSNQQRQGDSVLAFGSDRDPRDRPVARQNGAE